MSDETSRSRYSFPPARRLRRSEDFERVYRGGQFRAAGPLMIYTLPNDLGYPRLGMSLPRRVGGAVRRNRIRRRLREAFRHLQHDVPVGYDLVVNVRPHEPLGLAEYQRILSRAFRSLHRQWTEQPKRGGTGRPSDEQGSPPAV